MPTADTPPAAGAGLSRRSLLAGAGALGLGALVAACTGDAVRRTADGSGTGTSDGTTTTAPSTSPGPAPVDCVLAPEQTEGPYYIDADLVRRDITEGRPGTPLLLALTVADADTCTPIRDAMVDVWHCDALGAYSGFDGSGAGRGGTTPTRYMRGVQPTGGGGLAEIQTVYPGWYRGRTVHVHVKVHVGGAEVHTGQLYFPEDVTAAVYRGSPYVTRPGRDTTNATDGIYRDGGARSTLALRPGDGGWVGTLTLGVRRSGASGSAA